MMSDDAKNPSIIKMPLPNGHKMTVIKDENIQGPEYFKNLEESIQKYRLDKTLIRPPQEFCFYDEDELQSKVIQVLKKDVQAQIEEMKQLDEIQKH